MSRAEHQVTPDREESDLTNPSLSLNGKGSSWRQSLKSHLVRPLENPREIYTYSNFRIDTRKVSGKSRFDIGH